MKHGERQHVVKPGETLSSIAYDYGFPYPYLMLANPGKDTLLAGDTITIPSVDVLTPLPVVENKRIVISMAKQTVKVYENGQVKWDWLGSTGIDSSPTSPGIFQVQTHEEMAYAANWDLYMPWFMGIYRPVPGQEFMNGFHGFPSRDRRQLLWTKNLGTPRHLRLHPAEHGKRQAAVRLGRTGRDRRDSEVTSLPPPPPP